jgi:50S ribosomal subunit-associated GTPase HflX
MIKSLAAATRRSLQALALSPREQGRTKHEKTTRSLKRRMFRSSEQLSSVRRTDSAEYREGKEKSGWVAAVLTSCVRAHCDLPSVCA